MLGERGLRLARMLDGRQERADDEEWDGGSICSLKSGVFHDDGDDNVS